MKFVKYPKIENSYQEKHVDFLKSHGKTGGEWCVTEKIHGANLGIYCDETGCSTASRNQMLNGFAADGFYKFRQIKNDVYSNVLKLYEKLKPIEGIIVYGELFGGSYPGSNNSDVSSVQKGVFYSPDLHFHIFDIVVDGKYLDYDKVSNICEKGNIPYCEILFTGSFQECLDYPNNDESTIYDMFWLDKVEDNVMEGVVIKPIIADFLECGSKVVLKNKNDKFKEKNSKSKHQKTNVEVSEITKKVIDNVAQYITETRLDNVASKIGELSQKLIGEYIREFSKDVFIDANIDNVFVNLEKTEKSIVNKFVSNECKKLIFKRL